MGMPREDIGPTRLEKALEKLSDKGAKDFKKGMSSMEKTSKMGGFINFKSMLMQMIASSPAMEMFKNILEIFTSSIFAQIDWAALQAILTAITPLIIAFAEAIGEELNDALTSATAGVKALTKAWKVWDESDPAKQLDEWGRAFSDWMDSLGIFGAMLRSLIENADDAGRGLSVVNTNFGDFNLEMGKFSDLMANFKFPSVPGSIGGTPGGDGDWWDDISDIFT